MRVKPHPRSKPGANLPEIHKTPQFSTQIPPKPDRTIQSPWQVDLTKKFTPDLYMITPTYYRLTQPGDLTNVIQSAVLSKLDIQLIIVEDTSDNFPSKVVKDLAEQFSYPKTHTNITLLQRASSENAGSKMRGIYQRNEGLDWVVNNWKNKSAMVYFADDDNTYGYQLFHEFVSVGKENSKELVGVVPVGFIQADDWDGKGPYGSTVECKDRKVVNFHTGRESKNKKNEMKCQF